MNSITTYHRHIASALTWARLGLALGSALRGFLAWTCFVLLSLLLLVTADRMLSVSAFYIAELGLLISLLASAITIARFTLKSQAHLPLELLAKKSELPGDDLQSAYQLSDERLPTRGYSTLLVTKLVERVSGKIKPVFPFVQGFNRLGWLALFLSALLLTSVVLLPCDWEALSEKALFPLKQILGTVPAHLQIEPEEATIYRGQDLTIQVFTNGKNPLPPILYIHPQSQENPIPLLLDDSGEGVYTGTLKQVQEDTSFWAETSGATSETGHLHVVVPPHLSSLTLTLTPPAYSRKPQVIQSGFSGLISALPGTDLALTVALSGEAEEVVVCLGEDSLNLTSQKDGIFSGSVTVKTSQELSIIARDPLGAEVTLVEGGRIEMLTDSAPSVQLLQPEGDVYLATDLRLSLRTRLSDDYGLTSLALSYEISATGEKGIATLVNFPDQPLGATAEAIFDAGIANPLPGDILICQLVAYDNDSVNGPKAGYSRKFKVQVPQITDFFTKQEQNIGNLSTVTAEEVHQRGEQLVESIEKLADKLSEKGSLNYEETQSMKEIIKQEQELRQSAENLQKQLEEMVKENQDLLSLETLAKIDEVSKRLGSILDEETQKILKNLQQAIDSIPQEELAPYLEQAMKEQEKLSQELDQMLDILKRVEAESLLDALKAEAERMLEAQKDINQELSKTEDSAEESEVKDSLSQLADQESKLSEEAEKMGSDAENLQKLLSELSPQAEKALSEISDQEMEQVQKALQEAVSAMQGGNLDKSTQKGSSAQMSMEQLLSALSQMQSGYYDDQRQEIIAGIQEQMTALSELEKQAGELSDNIENQKSDIIKEQMNGSGELGKGISGVMKKYSQIMGQTLFLSPEGLKQLENAEQTLTDLSKDSVSQEQALDKLGEAMQGMNSAMLNLWSAKGGVENASTPSGLADMLSALEQIASGQQQLGGGMQSLFGGGMPMPSREQLLAMAAAQAALRQALEQLLQKYGALEQMTDELSGAVDAMKEIEKMLSEGASTGRIAEEQKHLMERLLSAERSLRTKGVSTERKSEPAKYYADPYVPEHLPPGVDLPSRFEAEGVEDVYGQEIPYGYGELIEKYWGGGER